MAYTKKTWLPRIAVKPTKFRKENETSTYVELYNEPDSISQAGTVFSADNMNDIEDGIELAHQLTVPSSDASRLTAVSGDGTPDIPDDSAGVTYQNIQNFTTADGWSAVRCTLSFSGGKMIVTATDVNPAISRTITTAGKVVRWRVKKLTGVATASRISSLAAVTYDSGKTYTGNNQHYHEFYFPADSGGSIGLYPGGLGAGAVSGDTFEISEIYIGTAIYLTPPLDKAGNHNTITNYGALPVLSPYGKMLRFLGAQYMEYDSPVIGTTGTIAIKVRFNELVATKDTRYTLFWNMDSAATNGILIQQTDSSIGGAIRIAFADSSGSQIMVIKSSTPDTTNIHTIFVKFTPTSVSTKFDDEAWVTTAITVGDFSSVSNAFIGARSVAPQQYFNGDLLYRFDSRVWTDDECESWKNNPVEKDSFPDSVTAQGNTNARRKSTGTIEVAAATLADEAVNKTQLDLKSDLASPTFTGTPAAPTAAANTNTTQIATTAFVNTEINTDRPYSSANPLMDGTAAQGSSANISRQDHVHPTDTSRAPLASPALTGTPTAPTADSETNTTQIATTAFVQDAIYYKFFNDRALYLVDDYIGQALYMDYTNINGTVTYQDGEANHPGFLSISSGANANSGARVSTKAKSFFATNGYYLDFIIYIPSTAPSTLSSVFGFVDALAPFTWSNGIYFDISNRTVSVKSSDGTISTGATTYVLASNTWYRLRLSSGFGGFGRFFIYNEAGTELFSEEVATNVPTAPMYLYGMAINTGTTALSLTNIDRISILYTERTR